MTSWIFPCNPKMYDALGAFRNLQFIYWTQRLKNIEVGDVVYIYLGAPVSRIVYKSEVIEKDVPFIDEVLNDKKYWRNGNSFDSYPPTQKFIKLRPLTENKNEQLNYKSLKSHGETSCLMGAKRIKDEQYLSFIESIFCMFDISNEEDIEFPTLESFSFVDLQLAKGESTPHTNPHSGKPSPDYEKEARKYKKLGDRGEYVVYQAEVSRLIKELSISESKAKKLIKWVSRESDAFGYDILFVNKDKTPRYIEVKATQRKVGDMDFYYTENEYDTAKKYGKDYYIYVVYEILTPCPKVWVIRNPFDDGVGINMKPVKYKVQLSTLKK